MSDFKNFYTLVESKQDVINLGYPELIAKLLQEKYGKHTFLIANWYKGYKGYGEDAPKEWWASSVRKNSFDLDINDMVRLQASTNSVEAYEKELERLDMSSDEIIDDYYLSDQRKALAEEIKEMLFNDVFFKVFSVIKDIESGKIRDVGPYKNLSAREAQLKYDQKRVFNEIKPIKTYENGYKWIDVGKRCNLVGDQMSNCGSVGVMSDDPDRTMLALFSAENKSHAVVTYSPNQRRISGDQGGGYTGLKPKYHRYVMDLCDYLGVRFDAEKSKSPLLRVKYLLKDKTDNVQEFDSDPPYNHYFRFNIAGQDFYSNGQHMIQANDLGRIQTAVAANQVELPYVDRKIHRTAFNPQNRAALTKLGVDYKALA